MRRHLAPAISLLLLPTVGTVCGTRLNRNEIAAASGGADYPGGSPASPIPAAGEVPGSWDAAASAPPAVGVVVPGSTAPAGAPVSGSTSARHPPPRPPRPADQGKAPPPPKPNPAPPLGPGLPVCRPGWRRSTPLAGLHGHPIKHIVEDDGSDPARHRQLVQQMVERDKVVAFVYNAAPLSGQSSIGYLNQERVPVVDEQGSSLGVIATHREVDGVVHEAAASD